MNDSMPQMAFSEYFMGRASCVVREMCGGKGYQVPWNFPYMGNLLDHTAPIPYKRSMFYDKVLLYQHSAGPPLTSPSTNPFYAYKRFASERSMQDGDRTSYLTNGAT